MTLYKRGRMWWVEFVSNGKRYRQSCHTENKKTAQNWVDAISTARRMPTFEEAVDVLRILFKQEKKQGLALECAWETYEEITKSLGRDKVALHTRRMRASHLRSFCEWTAKVCPDIKTVEQVTAPIAAKYAADLGKNGTKSKTRRNVLGDLSTIWKMLEKASDGIKNPWGNLYPSDDDSERGKSFSREEMAKVLEAARSVGKDWWGVVTVSLETGLRYGDVANLTWANLAMPSETQGAGYSGGVLRVTPRKTQRHGIQTAFPITERLAKVFDNQPRRGDFVFPLHAMAYEKSASSHGMALAFSEVLKAAGLDGQGFTFHSLRHTAATRLAEAGIGIETRKRILGHTEDATAERYDHADHLNEVRDAMERAAKTIWE